MKTHLSLRVRDVEASVQFYQALFGAAPHKLRPSYANFDLSDPPLKFALTQNLLLLCAPGQNLGARSRRQPMEIYVLTDDLQDDTTHDHSGNVWTNTESETPLPIAPAHRCCA